MPGYQLPRGGYSLDQRASYEIGGGHVLAAGGAKRLARYDFRTPVAQAFPPTAAGLAALMYGATPTSIFAGTVVDELGALGDMVPVGTTADDTLGVGLFDGASMIARPTMECGGTASTAGFQNAYIPPLDTTDALAIMIVFRCARPSLGTNALVASSEVGITGWALRLSANGYLFPYLDDGPNLKTGNIGTIPVDDGAWHCAVFMIDRAANEMTWWNDLESVAAKDTSTVTGDCTASAAGTFGPGKQEGFSNAIFGQVAYFAHWEGAEARKIAGLGSFWTHGQDPTARLTTNIHASLMSCPVAAGYVGHYSGQGVHGTDQTPLEYSAALADAANPFQIGIRCNEVVTNLIDESEDYSVDTEVTGTHGALNAVSPDGMTTAAKFSQSGLGGYQEYLITGLVAETEYHASEWLRSAVGQDCLVELRDGATNTAIRASDTHSIGATWARYGVTVTTAAAETSLYLRVYGGTLASSGWTCWRWGRQINIYDYAAPYVRTNGATATMAKTQYKELLAGLWDPALGEATAIYALDQDVTPTVYRTMFELVESAVVDQIFARYEFSGQVNGWNYNSVSGLAGLIQGVAHDAAARTILRHRWSNTAGLANAKINEILINGDDTWANQDSAAYTITGNPTASITPGSSGTIRQCQGILEFLEIYDRPRGY